MSKIYDSQKPESGGSAWFLRTGDGSVYGPLDVTQLRSWAEDCRVAPGNEVSLDKKSWVKVESLPEVDMNWMVELANGKAFGPINAKAITDFLKSGAVLPNSKVYHKSTGEKTTADKLLSSSKLAEAQIQPPPKNRPPPNLRKAEAAPAEKVEKKADKPEFFRFFI